MVVLSEKSLFILCKTRGAKPNNLSRKSLTQEGVKNFMNNCFGYEEEYLSYKFLTNPTEICILVSPGYATELENKLLLCFLVNDVTDLH